MKLQKTATLFEIKKLKSELQNVKPEYGAMLKNIAEQMPVALHNASNFHKSHSQFMQVTLDITAITPIRSIKHTLAEAERTRLALQETYFKLKKKQVEIKQKERERNESNDDLQKEYINIEITEIQVSIQETQNTINGALRKLNFLMNQHKQILKKLGKETITEEEYEREEVRYHIMTCMKQALNAARARGGVIDEGNLIYLFDLGINAAHAQAEIYAYLTVEDKLIAENKYPTHEMTMRWLESCADKWANDPQKFASRRGFTLFDHSSLTNSPLLDQQSSKEDKVA